MFTPVIPTEDTQNIKPLGEGSYIKSDNYELKIITALYNESVIVFEATSGDTILPLHFSLAAYMHPDNIKKEGLNAGHYLLSPTMVYPNANSVWEKYQMNYTNFQNGTVSKNSKDEGIMTLYYSINEDVRNQLCRENVTAYVKGSTFFSKCVEARRVQVTISLL